MVGAASDATRHLPVPTMSGVGRSLRAKLDENQRVRLEAIITREAHGLVLRTGGIPSLHLLEIHVRTARDYDQRADDEPVFKEARKMMQAELDALLALRR